MRGLRLFDEFMGRLREDSRLDVQYHRTGTLTLAFSDESYRRLGNLVQLMRGRGVSAELLDVPAVRREEPAVAPTVVGGLLIPSHGFVAAGEFTRALVSAARQHGVRFRVAPRAREIRQLGDSVMVSNGNETFSAGYVVNAAGAWAGQVRLAGAEVVPVMPVRGQLLHLHARGTNLRRVTWGDRCYLCRGTTARCWWVRHPSVLVSTSTRQIGRAHV